VLITEPDDASNIYVQRKFENKRFYLLDNVSDTLDELLISLSVYFILSKEGAAIGKGKIVLIFV
jgi:hypothetical protein